MSFFQVVLAIDFGTKRVGVAISRGSLAEPLAILANNDQLLSKIEAMVVDEQVEQIIVGLSENEMARKTQEFVAQLAERIKVPIKTVDETLSSYIVATKLKELKASLKIRQQPVDDRAAAEFLQEYLDDQA